MNFLTQKRKKGFTLLEVLIAIAIISGALITIIYTVNYHLSLIDRHETITFGTILGREKILEVSLEKRDKSGKFSEPFQDYIYEIKIEDTPYKDIKLVKLHVMKDKEEIRLMKFAEK